MSKVLHEENNDNDSKTTAIPWVFSENSQAKNICTIKTTI